MAIPFIHDFQAPYGLAQEISPLVRRVLAQNPSPFTYTGTGSFIIGRDIVAIIDPGPSDDAHIDALLKAIDGEELAAILVTHTHLDHSPAATVLHQKTGAPIYAFGPHGIGQQRALEGEDVEAGADKDFQPTNQLKDGDSLMIGDLELTAIHTPGHTSNHLCFYLPAENTLFTGDHIMGWSTTIISPPDGDMAAYLTSLEKLKQLGVACLRPIHGPAIESPNAFIDALIQHRHEREAKIYTAIKAGHKKVWDILPIVYHDIDENLYPAAARSTLSHILHLIDQEKVVAQGDISLETTYIVKG